MSNTLISKQDYKKLKVKNKSKLIFRKKTVCSFHFCSILPILSLFAVIYFHKKVDKRRLLR